MIVSRNGALVTLSDLESSQLASRHTVSPAELEAERLGRIKSAAGAYILLHLPDWKQRNLLAASAEELEKISREGLLSLTLEEMRTKSQLVKLNAMIPSLLDLKNVIKEI